MAQKEEKYRTYECHFRDNGSYRTMDLVLSDKDVKEWAQEFPDDQLKLKVL